MPIFPQKTKTQEVTYIDKLVIVVAGKKYHHEEHSMQEIRDGIAAILKQNNKILKAIGDISGNAVLIQKLDLIISKQDQLLQDKLDKSAVAAATSDLSEGSNELKDAVDKNQL